MPNESNALRAKTRRVKDHILDKFLALAESKEPLEGEDKMLYKELMLTFAKSVLPRTTEVGGDPDNPNPIPIYGSISIQGHNSDQEGISVKEENKGG